MFFLQPIQQNIFYLIVENYIIKKEQHFLKKIYTELNCKTKKNFKILSRNFLLFLFASSGFENEVQGGGGSGSWVESISLEGKEFFSWFTHSRAGTINHCLFSKKVNCTTRNTGTRVWVLVNSQHPSLSPMSSGVSHFSSLVGSFFSYSLFTSSLTHYMASLLSCHPLFFFYFLSPPRNEISTLATFFTVLHFSTQ